MNIITIPEAKNGIMTDPGPLPPAEMSTADFLAFRELIYREAGIHLGHTKITLLSNRIRKRLRALHINDFRSYFKYLLSSEDRESEIVRMLDVVTTNVSSFFRNPRQFADFREKVLPSVFENNRERKRIKILSAGCATGEEPYTVAIILLEYFPAHLADWNITIDAVDICTEVLKKAESGVYQTKKLLQDMDASLVEKYFKSLDRESSEIIPAVRTKVLFRKFNLKQNEFSDCYDIIFCRNVVIYFDDKTREAVYQKFYNALGTGGYFLVGPIEVIFKDRRFQYARPGIYTKQQACGE